MERIAESSITKSSQRVSRRYYRLSRIKVNLVCEGCGNHIEKIASEIDGVRSSHYNSKGLLEVRLDPAITTADEVEKAISESGHDTENYKAKTEFYSEKPKCCEYRETVEQRINFRA